MRSDSQRFRRFAHRCHCRFLVAYRANATLTLYTRLPQHNNHTGRWLSTFMARWHPSMDFFAVGCMKQPRRVQFFGADQAAFKLKAEVKGDYVTAVCSRNCMHRTEAVAAGGNASGRVIIIK